MNEIKKNIIIYFNYKDKYCIEDTINYKFFQKNVKVKDEENLIKNKRYCYQWNKRNNCYIENILSFSNEQTYSIPQISQMLGCISCCKDCLNGAYIYDLQSLKSKSISNTIQNTNSYKIITFRNKRNSTDYPILYHNKNQEIRYCLLENTNSLCSKTYTCYPVIPQNLIANELNKDVSKFSNVLYIILSIVFVIIIIGLIWAIFYVIRTYRRHKKINQVIDITGGDNYKGENEDKNENQEEKVYLSNNFDYCYDPSKVEHNNNNNGNINNSNNSINNIIINTNDTIDINDNVHESTISIHSINKKNNKINKSISSISKKSKNIKIEDIDSFIE